MSDTPYSNQSSKSKASNDDQYIIDDGSSVSFYGGDLQKGLKNRHVQLIALGGAIGTGLFVGSGFALYTCGPAALFLSYFILSTVVWFVMNMLAEMATFLPVPGAGAQQFINDYTDPSFGFALGYNYWYCYAMSVAAEVVAAALVIQYWTTSVNIAVWLTILLALILILNMCPVSVYGETEFYFAGIKLIAITGLIILGIVLFFGGGPNHDRLGFRYWKDGNAFHEYLTGGSTGQFLSFWSAIIMAGFAFVTAPEVVVSCSAETTNPRKSLPKCANQFVYRLTFFYLLGALVIGVIVSSRNEALDGDSSTVAASPFVLGIQNAGIPVLNHIINAVVLTSAASSGNSYLYAASRTLYSLALKGSTPKVFKQVNRFGVPYNCVLVSFVVGCLAYLNVSSSSEQVFVWLANITTISGFIAWIFVPFAYIRWRKAIAIQGLEDRVPYKTILQPYGAWYVLILNVIITITNGYAVFFDFNASSFVAAYITLPIVDVLYVGHRAYSYFCLGRKRWLTPYEEFDFSKLDMVEFESTQLIEPEAKNRFGKVRNYFA
ncbi:hypothetical protein OXX69_006693 [Metschnikowia pulcherrima]